MAKLIEELSDQELKILKILCDIYNASHEPFVMELAHGGIKAFQLLGGYSDAGEIVRLVCSEMRGRGIPFFGQKMY